MRDRGWRREESTRRSDRVRAFKISVQATELSRFVNEPRLIRIGIIGPMQMNESVHRPVTILGVRVGLRIV